MRTQHYLQDGDFGDWRKRFFLEEIDCDCYLVKNLYASFIHVGFCGSLYKNPVPQGLEIRRTMLYLGRTRRESQIALLL